MKNNIEIYCGNSIVYSKIIMLYNKCNDDIKRNKFIFIWIDCFILYKYLNKMLKVWKRIVK